MRADVPSCWKRVLTAWCGVEAIGSVATRVPLTHGVNALSQYTLPVTLRSNLGHSTAATRGDTRAHSTARGFQSHELSCMRVSCFFPKTRLGSLDD